MEQEKHPHITIGIDLGTGGVRALAVTAAGQILARASASLDAAVIPQPEGLHEQAPLAWWEAVCVAASELMADLKTSGISSDELAALSVDGTSGTLTCLDASGNPLRPAIMYNDARAGAQAAELTDLAGDFCQRLGYRFEASFALSKIAWVREAEPEIFEKTARFMHQSDYIEGCLIGDFSTADYSNALKTGYDLIEERWPEWLSRLSGVPDRLPNIVPPGAQIGEVSAIAAERTGLPSGLPVVTGATDGTAGCLASGMRRAGDYNTSLGTTLIFKGISRRICRHPDGIIYSHKLPGGYWLPGAASNTGGEWIASRFPGENLQSLDRAAARKLPNPHLAYPLARRGERFPFLSPTAEGFCVPDTDDRTDRYAACLQGTALAERLAYQILDDVAGTSGGNVFCTGGGSRSDIWMQCRADVTGRPLHRPACPEAAFGSAVLAAAGTQDADLWEAIRQMVRTEKTFTPNPSLRTQYDDLFGRFCTELNDRGYWPGG